ncbi:MAG: hypothetical protein L3K17_08765, partial [Thermoplasmata archaeon]|nr:hypothetical protein [Thermoplasmata archaeon]
HRARTASQRLAPERTSIQPIATIRYRPRRGAWVGVGLLCLSLLATGAAGAASGTANGALSSSSSPAGVCNPPEISPSALEIAVASPTTSAKSGGSLSFVDEIGVVNYSSTDLNRTVYVPSITVTFPLSPSGSFSIFAVPQTVTISGPGWPATTPSPHTKALTAALTFSTTKPSEASTQKIALMANASYGQLTLQVRWHWTEVAQSGDTAVNGSWSVPNRTAVSPNLPSEFYPAPYVPILHASATTLAPGANYTAELGGAIDGVSFRVVVEFPNNGTEITSRWQTGPASGPTFNVTAPMSYGGGSPLPAGKYLVHIHDTCEAMIHSISVTVSGAGGGHGGLLAPRPPGPGGPEGRVATVRSG